MFNRSEILRSAWADYRRDAEKGWGVVRGTPFNRAHFAYCLRFAWMVAKERAAKAAKPAPVATVAKPVGPANVARVAAIRAELLGQEYCDRIDWNRRRELRAELSALSA